MIKYKEGNLNPNVTDLPKQLEHLHKEIEIATFLHAQSLGIGDDVVRPKGWMWVIAKSDTTFFVQHLPFRFLIKTTPHFGLSSGILWEVEVKSLQGDVIVQHFVFWAIASQQTNKAIALPRELFPMSQNPETKKFFREIFPKLVLSDDFVPAYDVLIHPQDIDQNHHVHNTVFVQIVLEGFHEIPRHYRIDFQGMIFLEDQVQVQQSVNFPSHKRIVVYRDGQITPVCQADIHRKEGIK